MSQSQYRYYCSRRLKLHYVVWGDEGKPPLMLVHGGRDHCRNWDDSHPGHHDQLDRFLEVVSGFLTSRASDGLKSLGLVIASDVLVGIVGCLSRVNDSDASQKRVVTGIPVQP